MNKEALMTDKKLLASLEDQYNKTRRAADSIRAFVDDLNFEELVPDPRERYLMRNQLTAYEQVQSNLMDRIRFYRDRVKAAEQLETTNAEEDKYKPTTAQCVDNLLQRATDKFKELIAETDASGGIQLASMLKNFYALRHDIKEVLNTGLHHCGQDADIDDACCQARAGSVDHDAAPAASQTCENLKELEGMQVIKVCSPKCKDCPCGDGLREYPSGRDASSCVKVELVGGYYLCLTPLPNSIVTE